MATLELLPRVYETCIFIINTFLIICKNSIKNEISLIKSRSKSVSLLLKNIDHY
jgi:hypothetical protein